MGSIAPDPKKRGSSLPPGCKDLIHVLKGEPLKPSLGVKVRVNGKIQAREVRVVGPRGNRLRIMPLSEALNLPRSGGSDLVDIAPHAKPPVCRLLDYGKFRYDLSRRRKSKT